MDMWKIKHLPVEQQEAEIAKLKPAQIEMLIRAEEKGTNGQLPLAVAIRREKCLDSPAYMATEVLDPWYKKHFEPIHYAMLDEVLGPWLIGETVRVEGVNYDPNQYTGLLILFSRGTLKSTCLRIIAQWIAPYRKIRLQEDARTMFVHQVLEKAIEHSIAIRTSALENKAWRETFPEFKAPPGKEWDNKAKWRWPCFATHMATEYSFTCYGETSSKVGGHYTERLIDDWVTDDSVTTETQLTQSVFNFRAMDNLRDRTRGYNPWIACGTNYHFQDAYKQLEAQGGWLTWRVPAHTGSPKAIFDICGVEDRTKEGQRKIESKLRRLEKEPPGDLHFPALLPWRECYRTARAGGPQQYNTQILLNPMPEGEQRFDIEALDAAWVDDIPGPDEMWIYVRCDPAISEKKSADETAIIVGGVKWNGYRYIVDGWIGREKRPTSIVLRNFTLAAKWKAKGYKVKSIGFESVQYQEALAQIARAGVPERDARYSGESIPMVTKPCAVRSITRSSDMRKHERILEMDGAVSRRELKFWKQCPVASKVMLQFKNFPFDRFDALDATHDLWVQTMTPPPMRTDAVPPLHPELMAILEKSMAAKTPTLRGTNNQVRLTAWG